MSVPSSPRKIFGLKDNLSAGDGGEEEQVSKQKPPQPPRSAFMCFTDAKKAVLLGQNSLPQKKKELLNLVATEWRKLSARERAFWDEEARNDKVRFVREKEQYKGEWIVPKRRAKKHPGAPKRPMSAFLKYSQSRRGKVKRDNPDMSNTDISRLLGEMWRNASQAERSPYVESEQKERAAYKETMKKWRENQAKVDAATRTSHHVVQQTQRPVYHGRSSFDPFQRVHSVEEAIQKADRSFATIQLEDYSPDPTPRHAQTNFSNPFHQFAAYRSRENEHPPYRSRRVLPTSSSRVSYPFRPYPTGLAASQATYAPDSSPDDMEDDVGEQYPSTSRYFDRPRHSPYGFYQYP